MLKFNLLLMHTFFVFIILIISTTAFCGDAFQQDDGPQGIISIEAENYHDNTPKGNKRWEFVTSPGGYSGSGAMQALPDNQVFVGTYTTSSPRLDYEINFTRSGYHYILARGDDIGDKHGLHCELDYPGPTMYAYIRFWSGLTGWHWSDTPAINRARVYVETPGLHTISIWMFADGFYADKIVMTTDVNYIPTGFGPAESPRNGPVARASGPIPAHEQTDVGSPVTLKWGPGEYGSYDPLSHDLFIGTDYEEIDSATTTVYGPNVIYTNLDVNTYSLQDPESSKTYYWRVDENYQTTTIKGNIWNFTMPQFSFTKLEDFESYLDDADLKQTWSDQSDPDNDSGSLIYLNHSVPSINKHCLLMYCFNGTTGYSETGRAVPTAYHDFSEDTGLGVKALYLWFYGTATNPVTDPLYVMLEDDVNAPIVYYPDSNDLTDEQWQLWRIDLADFTGLNMTNVTDITVGTGDRNAGTGGAAFVQIYLDDFDLYDQVCLADLTSQGDLNGDCRVDSVDYNRLANEWKAINTLTADLFEDGIVDEKDLNVITTNWLADERWP